MRSRIQIFEARINEISAVRSKVQTFNAFKVTARIKCTILYDTFFLPNNLAVARSLREYEIYISGEQGWPSNG